LKPRAEPSRPLRGEEAFQVSLNLAPFYQPTDLTVNGGDATQVEFPSTSTTPKDDPEVGVMVVELSLLGC
jgi:hypothetical protein